MNISENTFKRQCDFIKLHKNYIYIYIFFILFTGTFKIQKTRLQKEGYKPQNSSEKIYFLNSRAGHYQPVTDELYDAINEGKVSL